MPNNAKKKLLIIAVVITLIVVFKLLNLGQYLNLSYLKESQETLQNYYQQHQLLTIFAYMIMYITATALSLPGATILTLAGGALFGLVTGTIIISFASTIGATLACIVSRYLLQEWVQKKFGDKLEKINQGMEQEGAFYLFTLRLVPVFPFFIINLVMGLTKLPVRTYYWVSQLGMFPATVVYVNAGRELGKIESLSGILSPGLLFSFVLLGVFPLAAKKIIGRVRWTRSADEQI